MDVLKTELEEAFAIQHFDKSLFNEQALMDCRKLIQSLTEINNGCAVLTDMADNKSYFSIGTFGGFLGLSQEDISKEVIESLDEDCIYQHIHPEDLVEKRMLELHFFQFLCKLPINERLKYRSNCRIRMTNQKGEYCYITNQTHILRNSPCGNMWLALCLYDLSPNQNPLTGIDSQITNNETGEVIAVSLSEAKRSILSTREKEILQLIKKGYLSKEISKNLNITINTVNRHRQNILQKLNVNNSLEAVHSAEAMKLF
ncbi:response regulator transcription factor [Dysgonomonas sp. HGC4]|uniref:response regulator transcription factor n=1 Tax=Dysgonomonas sp. HGC4 TaxID=1658009 RepID=UPI000681F126|nr:LuxR C-terminal-related transcriptional regulator [Dysgonomonas sp. HGC4]MBD8347069.1 response regulator transcription factor [Dysgonomonas sp. HGC4]